MKEFTLLGTTLNYSTQRLNYYSIHSVFLELAQTSWKQFYSDYQKMGSLQKAYEQLPKVIVRLVKSIDSSCEDYIKLQKIYSVGADDVGAGCTSALRELQQIYQERIAEPCEEIEERKNAEVAQREFKKKIKSNDLWDSLGYSAINAVGNLGSSLNASLDASSIYKNSDTLDQFKNAILDYVILAQRATMRLVQENSNIGYDEPDSSEVSKLQKITDNILNGTVPADQQDEMILQVLQGNPRAFELYRLLAVKYGDEDGTLEAMAECFDYPEFAAYKLGLLDKKFDDALSATHTDEQDIFDLKAKIEAYAARLSVNPEKQLARLKAQWDVLDRNLRTVCGKEYKTREEAQNVRDDIAMRNQLAAQYDLSKVNFLDAAQVQRFTEILHALPYKSVDVPEGLPGFVASITRRAVERCSVIESLADPENLPGQLSAAWAQFPIYGKIADKLKFGTDGIAMLQKFANRWAPAADEKLCVCQDISKLLSPGKVLVITSRRLCVILSKDVAQFSLDQIQSIQRQGNGCMIMLKDQPAYQTPFLVNLPDEGMDLYVRLLNDTIEGLKLTGIPREKIYVSIDSEEARAAEPQSLTGLPESVTSADPPATTSDPVPTSTSDSTSSGSGDNKDASSDDRKRLEYAKALAACGGTPDGILAAYEKAKTEHEAADKAYDEELAKNPQARRASKLSAIFLLGAFVGIILIFVVSLPVGIGTIIACLLLFFFFDSREKNSMATSSSAEARQAKLRKENASQAFETCKGYLNAKKAADGSGITPDDVQELVAQLSKEA